MKPGKSNPKKLSSGDREVLLEVLETRFGQKPERHKGLVWTKVMARLDANPEKLGSLHEMEVTGGEPDLIGYHIKTGEFDTRTSSWIATPVDIRERGGALYGERRYGRVFIGHNGAQSYYAVRGFRGMLKV